MTTKSEIEKAAGEESLTTAIKTTSQAAFIQGYLAGARKLLELAEAEKIVFGPAEYILIYVLRALVEGDRPQTTGDEPV